MSARVVVAGSGAICAAGKSPEEIWDAVWTGRSAIRPIQQWDASGWPTSLAGEIAGLDPRALVEDRKLHRLLQRSDLLGLYAAGRALDDSGFVGYREALAPSAAAAVNDRTGVFVGTGGSGYRNEYEFFPLLTAANGDLGTFGRELAATVNPMWLLRSMPNNVLCHIGIRHGLKGPNVCVTNHSVSGSTARRGGGRGAARRRGRPRPGGWARCAHRAPDGPLLPSARAPQRGRVVALRRPAQREPAGRRGGRAGSRDGNRGGGAPRQGLRRVSRQRLHHRGGRAAGHPRRRRRARGRDRPGTRRRRDARLPRSG